jgi:predicted anti-sigma-YlaC factor YlaD
MTCPRTIALGAYVLGALEREERGELETHLDGCATCRAELDRLAPLPELLSRVSLEEAQRLTPADAPAVGEAPRPATAPERRRPRLGRAVAVAAALVLAVSVAVAAALFTGDEGGAAPATLTAAGSDVRSGVKASVRLEERPWGTRMHLQLAGVRPGERCRLVARAVGGRSEVAATWRASYVGTAEVPGAVAIAPERLLALDIVASDGDLLVRMPVARQ